MALKAGTKLGPYEILSPLGKGGMGEVYRAKDTKLHREVAIKVLPADVASSPERLQRFEREATTVAALNHPNIVTIFGIEESDGHRFIAMELVEGETLDRMIAPGGTYLYHHRRRCNGRYWSGRTPRPRPRYRRRHSISRNASESASKMV